MNTCEHAWPASCVQGLVSATRSLQPSATHLDDDPFSDVLVILLRAETDTASKPLAHDGSTTRRTCTCCRRRRRCHPRQPTRAANVDSDHRFEIDRRAGRRLWSLLDRIDGSRGPRSVPTPRCRGGRLSGTCRYRAARGACCHCARVREIGWISVDALAMGRELAQVGVAPSSKLNRACGVCKLTARSSCGMLITLSLETTGMPRPSSVAAGFSTPRCGALFESPVRCGWRPPMSQRCSSRSSQPTPACFFETRPSRSEWRDAGRCLPA